MLPCSPPLLAHPYTLALTRGRRIGGVLATDAAMALAKCMLWVLFAAHLFGTLLCLSLPRTPALDTPHLSDRPRVTLVSRTDVTGTQHVYG